MDFKPLISELEELERFYKDAARVLEERLREMAYDLAREYIESERRRLKDSSLANTIGSMLDNIARSFIEGQQREELKGPEKWLQSFESEVESIRKEIESIGKVKGPEKEPQRLQDNSIDKLIDIKEKELYDRIKNAKGEDLYILIYTLLKKLEEMNPNYRLEY